MQMQITIIINTCTSIDSYLYIAHRLKRREDQHKSKAEDQHIQKRPVYNHDCGVILRIYHEMKNNPSSGWIRVSRAVSGQAARRRLRCRDR